MRRPLIGVVPCARPVDYVAAIRDAGGDVVAIDRVRHVPAELLSRLDGLLFTGGDDIDPSRYGAPAHPACSAPDPERDGFELALMRLALDHDMPLLAICRGLQVLNVASGGTLVQDIPSEVGLAVDHRLAAPPHHFDEYAHDISVEAGSRLASLLRSRLTPAGTCAVNSRHHQAAAVVGRGLVVSARAHDGVVEALEVPSLRFCLGVQWHPENFRETPVFGMLFDGLVDTARRRAIRPLRLDEQRH